MTTMSAVVVSQESIRATIQSVPVLTATLQPCVVSSEGGVTAHNLLTGLDLDGHLQYHTDERGDARYVGLLDPRLSDARTPTEHGHSASEITDLPVPDLTPYALSTDARFSDARTPLAHLHVVADITDFPEIPSIAGLVEDTDPRLSDARTPTAHQHPATDITDLPESSLSALSDVDLTGAAEGQALLFNGLLWTPGSIATGIERRFEAVSPYTYLGTAPLNSLDTAEVWIITRLDFTSGMVSAAAAGVAWNDRLTATYS